LLVVVVVDWVTALVAVVVLVVIVRRYLVSLQAVVLALKPR
jgi:hypothetical protein